MQLEFAYFIQLYMSKEKKRRSKIQSPNSGYIRFLLIKFLNLTKKRGGEKYFFSNEYHRAIYPLFHRYFHMKI